MTAADRPWTQSGNERRCVGLHREDASNKAHPICPEANWTPARSNRHRLVQAMLGSSPEAGEAAPRDDDSTRGCSLRWSLKRMHPSRRLWIGWPSAAQGVDGK
jgi:hypothetical protein